MTYARRIVALLACLALAVTARQAAAGLTVEQQQAIAWYDTLGYPNLKNAAWVRVATGESYRVAGEEPQGRVIDAFLLTADGKTFTIFQLGQMSRRTLTIAPAEGDVQRVGFERLDLAREAAATLARIKDPPTDVHDPWHHIGPSIAEKAKLFVFARGCAANGLDDLAGELFDAAKAMDDWNRPEGMADDVVRPLQAQVADEFANWTMWDLVRDFGDTKVSRTQMLDRHREFLKRFPATRYTARAKEAAAVLTSMLEQDAAHERALKVGTIPADPKDIKQLPPRLAELIFRLRDQCGTQHSQPGRCDIFNDERGDASPAALLAAVGFDAIPTLIEAMDDPTFTRSVGYHRDFHFSHHVFRVGDCARLVIENIAGRTFYDPKSDSEMVQDGKAAEVKATVRAWWDRVGRLGERAVLVEGVGAGDQNSPGQAAKLVEKYPDAAVSALRMGGRAATDEYTQQYLIEAAEALPGDAAMPFFLEQIALGGSDRARGRAAWAAWGRRPDDAVKAAVAQWREGAPLRPAREADALAGFLAACNSVDAIRALGDGLRARPVEVRFDVVMGLGRAADAQAEHHLTDPACLAAAERVLGTALDDTEERYGVSGSMGEATYQDPRICDVAAHLLTVSFKRTYAFKMSDPLPSRERQRFAVQNVWRAAHGQPPLAPVQPRTVEPVPDARLKPLLDRRIDAHDGRAVADIERLGIGALPGLRRALAQLPEGAEARPALEALARRLSCRIERVTVDPESVGSGVPLAAAIARVAGKPLAGDAVVGVIVAFAKAPPPGTVGIGISIDRGDDGTGVVVGIRLTPGDAARAPRDAQWYYRSRVRAGRARLFGSDGGSAHDHGQTEAAYKEFAEAIAKAAATPPDEPLEIRFGLRRAME